jgi:hypothetical protein
LSSWRMYEMHLALFLKAGCDKNYKPWAAHSVSNLKWC